MDVLAHVIGINADLRLGRFNGTSSSDEWTDAQVASRRGRSLDGLATEWDAEAPVFEDGLRAFGYEMGSHFLGDLLQHFSDVRHALGLMRVPDDMTLLVALDFYLDSFHETLVTAGVGSVRVRPSGDSGHSARARSSPPGWRTVMRCSARSADGATRRRSGPTSGPATWTPSCPS